MKPLIIANWKMHKTPKEVSAYIRTLARVVALPLYCETAIAPPSIYLTAVGDALRLARLPIFLAAQNVFCEDKGAFTGEISPAMLSAVGADMAIVGHSERRYVFGETNSLIAKKVRAALDKNIAPVLCVGETLAERKKGNVRKFLDRQLRMSLAGCTGRDMPKVVVAYEPVWAIGTGKTAIPADAEMAHRYIAKWCVRRFGVRPRRIIYGGSVTPENSESLLSAPCVEGLLVGGASLDPRSFARILGTAS